MQDESRLEIKRFLDHFCTNSDISEMHIPEELRVPRTPEEMERRSQYLHVELLSKAMPLIERLLDRALEKDEVAFISDRLKSFLESGERQTRFF